MTAAIASRVMSSWVGPSPPQTITASARSSAWRNAPTTRSWLSPTLTWKLQSMPASASCSPIQEELVSTIWPSSSSVPTATTSHRTAAPVPGKEVLHTAYQREGDRHPQRGESDGRVLGRGRQQCKPDCERLYHRLELGR